MPHRYTPFEKSLQGLAPADLAALEGTSEGWFVEYKSAIIKVKSIAKSLSSFANQYGGWLFFGVVEDCRRHVGVEPRAAAFVSHFVAAALRAKGWLPRV